MIRIKRGNIAIKRRKKILTVAKGFRGSHSRLFRIANQQVLRSLAYRYSGRKSTKRKFRQLWIIRINAATRLYQTKYSWFMKYLKLSKILLNRKMLAQLAVVDPIVFQSIVTVTSR